MRKSLSIKMVYVNALLTILVKLNYQNGISVSNGRSHLELAL